MAYKLGNRGIFPNLPGELVGNYNPTSTPGPLPFNSEREAEASMPDWSISRIGRPAATPTRSSAELAAQGWVGVYLTTTKPVPAGAEVCDTPDWMREPAA